MHKICFTVSLFHASNMFRAPCAHRQEVKIIYTAFGIITPIGGRPVHGTATYKCDDIRGCISNIDLLTMSTWCSKHIEA